jgi:hypothetical protein
MAKETGYQAVLPFYLEGRENASDEYDVEEMDIDFAALAGSVTSLDSIRARALDAAFANTSDIVEDSKTDWIKEHRGEIRAAGVTDQDAYAAWCKGYQDEVAQMLEAELVTALGDEDTAVETPSGKRAARSNPADTGSEATYAAWYQTGIRDCENTIAMDDFDPEIADAVKAFRKHRQDVSKLAAQAVKDYWVESEPESKKSWLEQNEAEVREDGLKPDRAYEFWADGWRLRAQSYVAEEIVKRAERD